MYSGYCTTQRKENRRGNRNIYRGVVKKPTIRMEMRNDKRDNEHRMIHCSGCGRFLATCKSNVIEYHLSEMPDGYDCESQIRGT